MEKPINELLGFSIINLDKPAGPTSFGTDLLVRKIIGKEKVNSASHFGTLDPQVTGVLPIALNKACKLQEYFMHKNKRYVGVMRVHKEVTREKLEEEIKSFIGKIKQTPPVKSRVKRETRERVVHSFKILEQDDKDWLFETEVQAGTYIRKLISDLGEKIGGAHMLELRRTRAGIFGEEDIVNLYELEKAVGEWKNGNEKEMRKILIPAEDAIKKVLPQVFVNEKSLKKLGNGSPIFREFLESEILKFPEGNFSLLKSHPDFKINGEKFAAFWQDTLIGIYRVEKKGNILAVPEYVYTRV